MTEESTLAARFAALFEPYVDRIRDIRTANDDFDGFDLVFDDGSEFELYIIDGRIGWVAEEEPPIVEDTPATT